MAATGIAREVQNRTKDVKSIDVITCGGYSRVVVVFDDNTTLYAYGDKKQARII